MAVRPDEGPVGTIKIAMSLPRWRKVFPKLGFSGSLVLEMNKGLLSSVTASLLSGTMLAGKDLQCIYRASKDGWKDDWDLFEKF